MNTEKWLNQMPHKLSDVKAKREQGKRLRLVADFCRDSERGCDELLSNVRQDEKVTPESLQVCEEKLQILVIDFSKLADEWSHAEATVLSEAAEYRKHYTAACEAIGRVQDVRLREFLRLRFIEGASFREIAGTMFYSIEWVFKLRKKAIKAIKPILAELLPEIDWE